MTWSEEKRKRIWGKKYNPAVLMGVFFMLGTYSAGIISFILGIILMFLGFRMYKKYSPSKK